VEMLSSAGVRAAVMWMHIVIEEHYTGCQHSTPFVLNASVQFFLVFCSTPLTLLWFLVE
jgi:hypothetical protein